MIFFDNYVQKYNVGKLVDIVSREHLILDLRKLLVDRTDIRQPLSYKEVAELLHVSEPPVIATITGLLEVLIDEDIKANRPVLSALVVQKGKSQIPRPGFFEKLNSLKVIDLNDKGFDVALWHASELNKLKKFYNK